MLSMLSHGWFIVN